MHIPGPLLVIIIVIGILIALSYLVVLVGAIVLIAFLISIFRRIGRISRKAEETTESFADLIAMVGKRVAPVALSAAVAAALRRFKRAKSNKEE